MDVLALLERRPNGATIREMVEALKLPRTTVYRILNTLQHHDMVRRSDDGSLRLGPRLLALAARTLGNTDDYDLASLSMPHLQALSEQTGEGSKVSVSTATACWWLQPMQGSRDYALTVVPGQRLPPHAGAASKVLLGFPAEDAICRRCSPGPSPATRAARSATRTVFPSSSPASAGKAMRMTRANTRRASTPLPRQSRTGAAR